MNNSEMFKKAHKIARETVELVGNYSIAFKLALKQVWAVAKASEKKISGYQTSILANSLILGAKSQGYNADWLVVDKEEARTADRALEQFWFNGELTEGQYYYAVWCYLIGQKLVDRWIKFDGFGFWRY